MQEKIYDLLRSCVEENVLLALELNNSVGNDLYLKGLYNLYITKKFIEWYRIHDSLKKNLTYLNNDQIEFISDLFHDEIICPTYVSACCETTLNCKISGTDTILNTKFSYLGYREEILEEREFRRTKKENPFSISRERWKSFWRFLAWSKSLP